MESIPEGHWPKIIRAEEHFAAARAEFDFYREGDVYSVIGKFDSNGREFVLRIELRYPPSPRFAILVGECLNSLRAALDHLAFQIVQKHAPDRLNTPETIKFPIHESRLDRRSKKRSVADLMAGVAGIPELPMALIERNQPYHRGDDAPWHPLAIIQRLTNIDKHRTLLLTGSAAANGGAFGITCNGQVLRWQVVWGLFRPGAEVVRFQLTPAEAKAYGCHSIEAMQMHGYAPIAPTFDEPEPPLDRPVYDVVQNCLAFVTQLVSQVASASGLI